MSIIPIWAVSISIRSFNLCNERDTQYFFEVICNFAQCIELVSAPHIFVGVYVKKKLLINGCFGNCVISFDGDLPWKQCAISLLSIFSRMTGCVVTVYLFRCPPQSLVNELFDLFVLLEFAFLHIWSDPYFIIIETKKLVHTCRIFCYKSEF